MAINKLEQQVLEQEKFVAPETHLTFLFPLNRARKMALGLIEKSQKEKLNEQDNRDIIRLLKSDDFIEQQAAIFLFQKTELSKGEYQQVLKILDEMAKNPDLYQKLRAAHCLGHIELDEKYPASVFKTMEENLVEHLSCSSSWLNEECKNSLFKKELRRLLSDFNIESAEKLVASEMSKKGSPQYIAGILNSIFGELINNCFSSEESLLILEKIKQSESLYLKIFRQSLEDEKGKQSQNKTNDLTDKKPLFATEFKNEIRERLAVLQEIYEKLKNKFSDDFIGFTVFGGTYKGRFHQVEGEEESSDVDCAILAINAKTARGVLNDFGDLLQEQGIKLCTRHRHILTIEKNGSIEEKNKDLDNDFERSEPKDDLTFLFSGLFFGDRKKLKKIQLSCLRNIKEPRWNKIRQEILGYEIEEKNYDATVKFDSLRGALNEQQIKTVLNRVPLSYQETLGLLEKPK